MKSVCILRYAYCAFIKQNLINYTRIFRKEKVIFSKTRFELELVVYLHQEKTLKSYSKKVRGLSIFAKLLI